MSDAMAAISDKFAEPSLRSDMMLRLHRGRKFWTQFLALRTYERENSAAILILRRSETMKSRSSFPRCGISSEKNSRKMILLLEIGVDTQKLSRETLIVRLELLLATVIYVTIPESEHSLIYYDCFILLLMEFIAAPQYFCRCPEVCVISGLVVVNRIVSLHVLSLIVY
jgi:hypothetical protein